MQDKPFAFITDMLDKVDDYVAHVRKTIEESDADKDDVKAVDEVAEKLKINFDKMIEPSTPLSATPADAVKEGETKIKTKTLMLGNAISKKIGDMLHG